jgi:hypothetical protein
MPPVDENADAIEARRQELLRGLGLVVDAAALMEYELRVLFCALMGTPLATVIAAKQNAEWLIENCKALTKATVLTGGLNEMQAERIRDRVSACKAPSEERGKLVHGIWQLQGEDFQQADTARHSPKLTWLSRTPDELQRVTDMLNEAAEGVEHAIPLYLGADRGELESALRETLKVTLSDDARSD